MKTLTLLISVGVLSAGIAGLEASDRMAIYARVDRVVLAPNATAFSTCSGVSALVRTLIRVTLLHQSIN